MGTCGNDYCTTAQIGYILLGTATTASTVPTTTEACNMIQAAEALINGYLHKSASYTTVPTPITAIAIKIVINIASVKSWWVDTEGATSVSDPMGSATFPADLVDRIMTDAIKKELDDFIKNEDYYLSSESGLVIFTPQDTDLDFSDSMYQ